MVTSRKDDNPVARRAPAKTVQGRENQLIDLAYDVAERQLLAGTASSQVITQLLKFGTERERLERVRIEQAGILDQAKVEQIANGGRLEELYTNAMDAFRGYLPSMEDEVD